MAEVKPAAPPPDALAPFGKFLGGCLKIAFEILAALAFATLFPPALLLALIKWAWPWYASIPTPPRNLDDALIALASVAGVLWSGAIIAYSIHHKYTPPLRTGVQLLNFAILAPLVGLVAQGAELRTAFYFAMWFFIFSAAFSMSNLEMLKPGKFTLKVPDPVPNETPEATKVRLQLTALRLQDIELFKRVAHGTRYFALVSVLCLATFITAKASVIAWSCLILLVVSLFLMLPEVFNVTDIGQEKPQA